MASTICDFTAVTRRPDSLSGPTDAPPRGVPVRNPIVVPPIDLRRQVVGPVVSAIPEPLRSSILHAVDIALELHLTKCGATVSLFNGNMLGSKRFAVSVYPDRTVEFAAPPTKHQLLAFVVANLGVLLLPNRALGTWYADTNRHVLDAVFCARDEQTAVKLGKRFKQWSVYDLDRHGEILIRDLDQARVFGHGAEVTTI